MASVLNKPMEKGENSGSNLTSMKLSDCNCAICMYILIEPVTMPCGHEMCMSCFKKNVQESSLTCPMCRVRISTWARRAAKSNTLINQDRWRAIQEAFPIKVANRLNNKEDDSSSDEETEVWVNLSKPGEIREEYEKELKRLENERKQEQQAELEASARLLSELGADELQEAKRREVEIQQMAADELLARKLQTDFNDSTQQPESLNDSTADVLRLLEERSRSSASSKNSHSRSGSRMMNKFLAKGKRQMQNQQGVSPYPYVCGSPSEKNNENQQQDTQQTEEDKSLAASLMEIFGRPVSESPQASPTEAPSNAEDMNDHFLVPEPLVTPELKVSKHGTPETSTSKASEKEVTVPPDKPPDVVVACAEDSISQELVHFRPIHASPKTPPRRLPGGRLVEHKIIRSTPIKLTKIVTPRNEEEEEDRNITESLPGMQSPVMQKRLKELAVERRFQVVAQSKSTCTEAGVPTDSIDQNVWNRSEERLRNTVKYATATAATSSSSPSTDKQTGKISIQSLFKKKAAAATVASSSANDALDELPDLPDLSVTVISDSDDDDEVVVTKAILPLESNVDEDLLLESEPLGLSSLSKLLAATEVFDESIPSSEGSRSSGQLFIADGHSEKESKPGVARVITEHQKVLNTPLEQDLRCNSLSKAADDISRSSSNNLRPLSDVPSLFTSEILSSASCSTASTSSSDNVIGNGDRLEVNLKVIDESARMETALGDSDSLLGTNVLQMSKPSESGDKASIGNVNCIPVGPSPSALQSSRSSEGKEQFTSIKEWFKKWSSPSNSSKKDEIDGSKEVPKATANSSKSSSLSTMDSSHSTSTISKLVSNAERSPLESSTSYDQKDVQLDNMAKNDILAHVPSPSAPHAYNMSEISKDNDAQNGAENPSRTDERFTVKGMVVTEIEESENSKDLKLREKSKKSSLTRKEVAETSVVTDKKAVVQPQTKRSSRPKKFNERYAKDYVVESPLKFGPTASVSSIVTKVIVEMAVQVDEQEKSLNERTKVEHAKKESFVESKNESQSVDGSKVESTTGKVSKRKGETALTPRKRKAPSNGESDDCQAESLVKTPKKAKVQRSASKQPKRSQKNEVESAQKVLACELEGMKKLESMPSKSGERKSRKGATDESISSEEVKGLNESPGKAGNKTRNSQRKTVSSPSTSKRKAVSSSSTSPGKTVISPSRSQEKAVSSLSRSPIKTVSSLSRSPIKTVSSTSRSQEITVSSPSKGKAVSSPSRSQGKAISSPSRSPRKASILSSKSPRKGSSSLSKNEGSTPKDNKDIRKGDGGSKELTKGAAVRSLRNAPFVPRSPKRKISETDEPSTPQKKMLKTIKDSSCVAHSDEDGCETDDNDATIIYEPGEMLDDNGQGVVKTSAKKSPRKESQAVPSKRKASKMVSQDVVKTSVEGSVKKEVKCSPSKGKASKLGRVKKTVGKTNVYKVEDISAEHRKEIQMLKKPGDNRGRKRGLVVEEKAEPVGRSRKKAESNSGVKKGSVSRGPPVQSTSDGSPRPSAAKKVDEDKENETDEVFVESNVKRLLRGTSKNSAAPCTPPKKEEKFLLEYSPRSGGKKVVINKIPRKKTTAQRQLKLSSRGTIEQGDSDDFEEPAKKRKGPVKKGDSSGKQMTMLDLFGKPKPETSVNKPAKSNTRSGRAKTNPVDTKQVKTEEVVADDDENQEDSDGSDCEIDQVPRSRRDFASDKDYKEYLENRDLQMAVQLQAEFEFEAKYKLNCIRRKGSQNSYSFRRK